MKALGLNVIVDVTDYFEMLNPKERVTESGIILPSGAKEKNNDQQTIEGTIVALSKKAEKESGLKTGDVIIMLKSFGNRYEKDDKTYAILSHKLILAKKE